MCRTARKRRRGTGSVEVRTRKQQGWVDEWRTDERKKFQCELKLSNKSRAENNCPFVISQRR